MANWDLSSTATSTITPSTSVDWNDEIDHMIPTSLTNIDPTSNTYWTSVLDKINDVYVTIDWASAFNQSSHTLTGGAELAPPSGRGSSGQLWPRGVYNK